MLSGSTRVSDCSEDFVEEVGLCFTCDDDPGFTRKRKGKGFVYFDPQGHQVKNEKVLERIRALVIPPAWEDVWICTKPNGHLQVTGRDARGRKQYRYHSKWSEARNLNKFTSLQHMPEILRKLRPQLKRHLELKSMCREKVLAVVITIMEETNIRIGNDAYAKENGSYGLTTLRNKHARIKGQTVTFNFKGKSGIQHSHELTDQRLSRIIRKCQDLPGEELFTYVDESGVAKDVTSQHVNDYLREITGTGITAKDFRTWGASRRAVEILAARPRIAPALPKSQLKKLECGMIKETAQSLGNTVAVCRKYYVHPGIFESYVCGQLHRVSNKIKSGEKWLRREEKILHKLLTGEGRSTS